MVFRKKNHKIYFPTKNTNYFNGTYDRSLDENIPEYLGRSSDFIIQPEFDNNTMIVMGRDRFSLEKEYYVDESGVSKSRTREQFTRDPDTTSLVSGYSDHQGAGAIDIVVGRGAPYPVENKKGSTPAPLVPLFQTIRDAQGAASGVVLPDEDNTPHPRLFMDAARIYISQMSDIDRYFDIDNDQTSMGFDKNPTSAIMIKADRCRIHSRRDIKIVAGGDGLSNIDSNGYLLKERPKIHLMVGNGKVGFGRQQPIPLGINLLKCIKRVYDCQQNILEVVNNLMTSQMALNIVVSNSIRVSPAGPTAPDPVSQAMATIKGFMDMNDMFNIYFSKFFNIPTDELGYLNPSSRDYILSRNVTVN